jgi:hypothetical protein
MSAICIQSGRSWHSQHRSRSRFHALTPLLESRRSADWWQGHCYDPSISPDPLTEKLEEQWDEGQRG